MAGLECRRARRSLVLAVLAAFLATAPLTAQLARLPTSPTMRSLAAAGLGRQASIVDTFWDLMSRLGAPLVEPADSGYSLLTFLYHGDEHTRAVRVVSNLNALAIESPAAGFDTLGGMDRLPGTDVWQRTYRVRDDLRIVYHLSVTADGESPAAVIDSLNRTRYLGGTRWEESLAELPAAPPRPWRDVDSATGRWVTDSLESRALGGQHQIQVYVPRDFDATRSQRYAVLIACEPISLGAIIPTDRMVDYFVAHGVMQPTLFVLVEDLAGASDSTGYDPAANYLADDVLPRLRERFHASADAADVIVTGASRRGLVAAVAAFRRSDAIGNALTLSGSFYRHPRSDPQYEWLPRLIAASERKPIRLYVTAGALETVVTRTNAGHYLLATNRHLRDVLQAKGYEYGYREFYGVHSEANWEDALADGLRWLAAHSRTGSR